MKGYAVYKLQLLIRTHDLERILNICINLDNSFQQLDLLATSLNGLDVRFRYPDIEFEPDEAEVIDAIKWAEQVFDFVTTKCI